MVLRKTASIFIITLFLLLLLILSRYHSFVIPALYSFVQTSVLNKNSSTKKTSQNKIAEIEKIITDRLIALESNPEKISSLHLLEDSTIEISAPVPRGQPMESIIWSLGTAAASAGYSVKDCFYKESPFSCTLTLISSRKRRPTVKVTLTRSRRYSSSAAKMAIIISDFTYRTDATVGAFFSFPEPLTFSLLSSKELAQSSANIAQKNHKETIILLPMEPLPRSYRSFNDQAIMVHYTPDKIRQMITKATTNIPHYSGFTNLGGSRTLLDSRVMKIVLSIAAEKKNYFLFDCPPHRSQLTSIAQKEGVPIRYIDISIDNHSSTEESVADSLRHAVLIAQKKGSVILSAYPTQQFLSASTRLLPYFHHNGIELVTVSELLNRK